MVHCEYRLIREPTVDSIAQYAQRIDELEQQFFDEAIPEEYPEERISDTISRYYAIVLLMSDETPVGFATLAHGRDVEITEISAAFVDIRYRSKHLSGTMFDMLIDESRNLGAAAIDAMVAGHAMGVVDIMLKRRGFTIRDPNISDMLYTLQLE